MTRSGGCRYGGGDGGLAREEGYVGIRLRGGVCGGALDLCLE